MTFFDHLEVLRWCLIRIGLVLIVAILTAYGFSEPLFSLLLRPLCQAIEPAECTMHFTGLTEPFMVYLKVGILGGVLTTLPYAFIELWGFVAPGLYRHEKRWIWPFVVGASALFLGGALFGYVVVFPPIAQFFLELAGPEIQPVLMMNDYFGFVSTLLVGFGLIFELPVLLIGLYAFGILNSSFLLRNWRYAVVILAIVAAVLTPADPWSMIFMAIPLITLYFLTILIILILERRAISHS